jgi:hypothetical protein
MTVSHGQRVFADLSYAARRMVQSRQDELSIERQRSAFFSPAGFLLNNARAMNADLGDFIEEPGRQHFFNDEPVGFDPRCMDRSFG